MRKKTFLAMVIATIAMSVSAQNAYFGTGLGDNWYISFGSGGVTPTTHSKFWKDMRYTTGVEIGKQITPILALGLQGTTAVNVSKSRTAFDNVRVYGIGKVNLNNLIGGYLGEPRMFEIDAVAGMGWGHDFVNSGMGKDRGYMVCKVGASFHFNAGESKRWTFSFDPAISYRMECPRPYALNVQNSAIELVGSMTYHFGSSNGENYITIIEIPAPGMIDDLNSQINAMRQAVSEKDNMLAASAATIQNLENQLAQAQANQTDIENVDVTIDNYASLEPVISFKIDQAVIQPSQMPAIAQVAAYLKNNPNATIEVNGYASPDGPLAYNDKLAQQRANAVKDVLVNNYQIDPKRITAKGRGVGDVFPKPTWNRASIIILNK
ncbi:OmpA family protein [uncultured Bacteroides sp.]|uniref:OmpA family protein n=1 Tax=uncultured Bacteroides sp. TaxID=162156 RepID=UPI00260B11AF|nr:OmpA family protein [uncultured Bacteroides sp.]